MVCCRCNRLRLCGPPPRSKVDVNGAHTHPVYQFLKRELPVSEGGGGGSGAGKDLIWNFQVRGGRLAMHPSTRWPRGQFHSYALRSGS